MGFINKILGKQPYTQESEYRKLIPLFQESFNLLIEFSMGRINDKHNPDSVEIGTSASAIVAAAYFVNSVAINNQQNINREKIANEIIETSNRFFDYVSGALAKNAEREIGKKIDMNDWMLQVTELQQDKVGKYIGATINTFVKRQSGKSGFDITIAIMEDLFGKIDPDLIFHEKLISFMSQIKS